VCCLAFLAIGADHDDREPLTLLGAMVKPMPPGKGSDASERRGRRLEHARPKCPIVAVPVSPRSEGPPPVVESVQLGDGWGCATLHDHSRYCWQANAIESDRDRAILAKHVPWLENRRMAAGPDRICVVESRSVDCFRAPAFFSHRWWPLPGDGEAPLWWSLPPLDRPRGPIVDPTQVTHGAWRGCSEGLCWGPARSAATAWEICESGAVSAPCALVKQATLDEFADQMMIGAPMIGDLFSCVRTSTGLRCVGASRDGFFGTPAECPAELRRAWPTAAGSVAAPHAACSLRPVAVRGTKAHGNLGSAGPRGLCFEETSLVNDEPITLWRCFGAVKLPAQRLQSIAVGLGDEPSACGTTATGQLLCWGRGYSPASAPQAPVAIRFELPQSDGVAWFGQGPFHRSCQRRLDCGRSARPLPRCRSAARSLAVDQIGPIAEGLSGQHVNVRGALVIAQISRPPTAMICCPCVRRFEPDEAAGGGEGNFCCPAATGAVVLLGWRDQLAIHGLGCSGDTSKVCCDAPAFGQTVRASGRLEWGWVEGLGFGWKLAEAELCEP
jgi:hypothetical protein